MLDDEVDPERILTRLKQLSAIGRDPAGGITRFGYTLEERRAHELVSSWLEEAGARIAVDGVGNLIGRFGKRTGPAVAVGSHLDTVRQGGSFDGALGVVAAAEVAQRLGEARVPLAHAFEVIVFAAEESSRFRVSCLGSGMMAGVLGLDALEGIRDEGGISVPEAMRAAGLKPANAGRSHEDLVAFLELHIEQGSILENAGVRLGVVHGIAGVLRLAVHCYGRSDHSGTTPMAHRQDALAAASEVVLALESSARALPGTVATVGALRVSPGVVNVVPGEAHLLVDIRDVDPGAKDQCYADLEAAGRAVQSRRGVRVEIELLRNDPSVPLPPEMIEVLSAAVRPLAPPQLVASGANHDTGSMARMTRAGLLFVPSHGGRSHTPEEWTNEEDVILGVRALLRAVHAVDHTAAAQSWHI